MASVTTARAARQREAGRLKAAADGAVDRPSGQSGPRRGKSGELRQQIEGVAQGGGEHDPAAIQMQPVDARRERRPVAAQLVGEVGQLGTRPMQWSYPQCAGSAR